MSGLNLAENHYPNEKYEKAIEIWKSHPNNSHALYSLGYCYENGKGVCKNYEIAFDYYSKSLKMYNISAAKQLIIMYMYELGIKFDIHEIMNIYNKIDNKMSYHQLQDYSHIQWLIGECYMFTEIHNYDTVYYWYKKSYATYPNHNSVFSLAKCYRYGRGVPVDHKKAMGYYNEYLEFTDIEYKYRAEQIINSYEEHGTADYENTIKFKIELIIILLDKIPKVLGQIIGEYLY